MFPLQRHPSMLKPVHSECLVCACITRQKATAHIRNLVKMRSVAASLPLPYAPGRDSGRRKQETPEVGASEGLTAPTPVLADGRVADVDGGTGPGPT
jgi:hypothetical protein